MGATFLLINNVRSFIYWYRTNHGHLAGFIWDTSYHDYYEATTCTVMTQFRTHIVKKALNCMESKTGDLK